jgi:hypothetical protein
MRRVDLRLVVVGVGVSVEAFMHPGLRGGLQLKQVALTCTHVFCHLKVCLHENLAAGCVPAS